MKSKTVNEKPNAYVIGKDSNVFVTLGICTQALIDAKMNEKADELNDEVFNSGSYHEAINIMRQYVTFK